ncbi:MAG: hypothetical protein LIP08_13680 [Bacteroides sp.]|nr:hypothetical protein [Bacteroides sp.]
MHTFLFDILPETGHIRITLQLALLLNEQGNEVYYTDSSDSVFTSGLLEKGVGRILYPDDLRWFTPDLVLLDYHLQAKAAFYHKRKIRFVYLTASQLGETASPKVPVISLPPSAYSISLTSPRMEQLLERVPTLKDDPSHVLIVGLLEEGEPGRHTKKFYEVVKNCCMANSRYQLILLTHDAEMVQNLFPIPENMAIYRLLDLPALLPLCDVALTTGNLNTLIESVYAGLPMVTYPSPAHTEHRSNAMKYVNAGLGMYADIRKTTPRKFGQQIEEILNNRERFRESSQQTQRLFDRENKNLERVADRLLALITTTRL